MNDVVGIVFKYGLALLHISENDDRETQQFPTKFSKNIKRRNNDSNINENDKGAGETLIFKNAEI